MNAISLPYHLIIPSIISILILCLLFYNRKQIFKHRKRKWFWISMTLFFTLYLLIVVGAAYSDISLKLNLQSFDLDGNGFFTKNEITAEQKMAMNKVISDVGRNLSFISGLIFSAIIASFAFIVGKTIEHFKKG